MRHIAVTVVVHAARNAVVSDGRAIKVYVTAPAVGGKANAAVVDALAAHFGVKKRSVTIIRGVHSRKKIIAIDAEA